MRILYYCLHHPRGLKGRLSGPTRLANAIGAALNAVQTEVTFVDVDEYRSDEAMSLERSNDVIHCSNPTILTALLERGSVPDVIGVHAYAPSKRYRELGGYYQYPGYENDPDRLYDDATWIRSNFQEERFRPRLLKKIRVVQPCVEVDEILPRTKPFSARRYILWAGGKGRVEKNWSMMEQIMRQIELPDYLEWKVLTDYAIEDYFEVLDQTALMVFTSKYESFGFQLFEAWAKAVPTIYQRSLWGRIPFGGCGGLPVSGEDYSVRGFCEKLEAFLRLDVEEQERLGLASRQAVVNDFAPRRMGRELKTIYTQILEARR